MLYNILLNKISIKIDVIDKHRSEKIYDKSWLHQNRINNDKKENKEEKTQYKKVKNEKYKKINSIGNENVIDYIQTYKYFLI